MTIHSVSISNVDPAGFEPTPSGLGNQRPYPLDHGSLETQYGESNPGSTLCRRAPKPLGHTAMWKYVPSIRFERTTPSSGNWCAIQLRHEGLRGR